MADLTPLDRLRGMLERLRDGGDDLPRSSAWVMLDFLHEIERAHAEALEVIADGDAENVRRFNALKAERDRLREFAVDLAEGWVGDTQAKAQRVLGR